MDEVQDRERGADAAEGPQTDATPELDVIQEAQARAEARLAEDRDARAAAREAPQRKRGAELEEIEEAHVVVLMRDKHEAS